MKVAIVHDYLTQAGGAERVLGVLHEMFPAAPIYTTILDRASLWSELRTADIRVSWMQRLPGVGHRFQRYLPFYPFAIEGFDLSAYDVVISSSSAFAKAAITRPDALHVCYCHTPMRFAWHYEGYVQREAMGRAPAALLKPVMRWLRAWDVRTSHRPDVFVANSSVVHDRIRSYYGRESEVVYPPVDLDRYQPTAEADDAYLVVSRLVPYKRIDVAIRAFSMLGRPLIVIGDGRDLHSLRAAAAPCIRFLGRQPDETVARYYASCRALICTGEEDFGITPLEANAAGRPVVAYGAGGALETVEDGRTGVLFRERTPEALISAVQRCDGLAWDRDGLRRHAGRFDRAAFRTQFRNVVDRALAVWRDRPLREPRRRSVA